MTNRTTRVYAAATAFLLFCLSSLPLASAQSAPAQNSPASAPRRPARSGASGSITGSVKDNTGGVIPGASVSLSNGIGIIQTVQSDSDGSYVFRGVAPGTYTVSATYSGLAQKQLTAMTVNPGQTVSADIAMILQAQRQEVTVTESNVNTISTEPANNATALVLKPEDLDALPDDPDDLQADLQALAGPSAGPGGNQIFIDGFSGGRLPPKESIREIRVNSNPFSAEFDRLGYGRIQIFTKPGSDKFHGQSYYNISDTAWDARNPFSTVNPPFRSQLFGGNVSGPLGKHASFFVDVERRQIDDNGIIVASVPTSDFLTTTPFGTAADPNYYPTPQRRTTVSPRLDYQINSNNTLSVRYSFLQNDRLVTGVGGFNLPQTHIGNQTFGSNGYGSSTTEHSVQLVETAVLSPRAVNETHFQFDRENISTVSQSTSPELFVGQSFVVGGSGYSAAGYGGSYDLQNNYELQNYTSLTLGTHTTKFGIRIRADVIDNSTPRNFNGIYQFLGGNLPQLDSNLNPTGQNGQVTSIQQYLTTERLLAAGRTPAQIAALKYGPSKYTVSGGNPYIGFSQIDFGPFIQDDWKVRPNLTVSTGVRVESQTNINDHSDIAPRFAFAWSPKLKGSSGRSKTVIRGGWGIFYDRFSSTNVETALRYLSSVPQTTYTINSPASFDPTFTTGIPISALSAVSSNQIYQIDRSLQAPRLMQTAIGVERQLFRRTTLGVNFTNSRGVHELRTVDINAPIPTFGQLPPGAQNGTTNTTSGVRPFGNVGDIYNYESNGIFKQTQVLVNVNTTVGKLLTLFTRYSYTDAHSDTDGLSTLPTNPYNFKPDWGRSVLDVSHSLFLGGSITGKWGIRLSPFIVLRTGTPFNITTGTDLYLQGNGTPTARPSVVDSLGLNTQTTSFGILNTIPLVGQPLIERNAGTGGGFIGLNLRVSKTFGFGPTKFQGASGGASAGGGGGPRGGGGGFGGGGMRGGPGGGFGGESSEHRYNLTLSVNARNVLNHENLNTFNGSLTSPYFDRATNITGGFGAEATSSNQRRLDLQLRFAF